MPIPHKQAAILGLMGALACSSSPSATIAYDGANRDLRPAIGATTQRSGQARPGTADLPVERPLDVAPYTVNDNLNRSLSISPNGRFVTFAPYDRISDGRDADFFVYDRTTSQRLRLPVRGVRPVRSINPAWSPNSRYLAYIGEDAGVPRLIVWDQIGMRTIFRSPETACGDTVCFSWRPIWSADSRFVAFISEDTGFRSDRRDEGTAEDPITPQRILHEELVGMRRGAAGVTVLPRSEGGGGASTGPSGAGPQALRSTQLVSMDVTTGTSCAILRNRMTVGALSSATGTTSLLVVRDPPRAGERSRHYSYFAFDLASEAARCQRRDRTVGGAPTAIPDSFVPIARQVANSQRGTTLSLSPEGRLAAWTIDTGTGDLWIADTAGGVPRNLTASFQPPGARPQVGESFTYPVSDKFDARVVAPIWSTDGSTLYLFRRQRADPADPAGAEPQQQIWRISPGRPPALVRVDRDLLIEGLPTCSGDNAVCVTGPGDLLFASGFLRSRGTRVLVRIDLASGRHMILQDLGASAPGRGMGAFMEYDVSFTMGQMVIARGPGIVVGRSESREQPPELWAASASDGQDFSWLAQLNPNDPAPVAAIRTVRWRADDGRELRALVSIPRSHRSNVPLPALMIVYGSRYGARDGGGFDGGPEWFARLRDRYAIILPDLPAPIVQNSGTGCVSFARNAERALSAASAAGMIDPDRVAVMGHSFGGYTATCVLAHSRAFRAGVAINGFYNLTANGIFGGGQGVFGGYLNLRAWPWERPDLYARESPLLSAGSIGAPLMIVYGKRDVTDFTQPYGLYGALTARGRDVQLIGYDDSAHNDLLAYPDFWNRLEPWLERHLRWDVDTRPVRAQPRSAAGDR